MYGDDTPADFSTEGNWAKVAWQTQDREFNSYLLVAVSVRDRDVRGGRSDWPLWTGDQVFVDVSMAASHQPSPSQSQTDPKRRYVEGDVFIRLVHDGGNDENESKALYTCRPAEPSSRCNLLSGQPDEATEQVQRWSSNDPPEPGYTIEAAIPWDAVGAEAGPPPPGTVIGMDVHITAADDDSTSVVVSTSPHWRGGQSFECWGRVLIWEDRDTMPGEETLKSLDPARTGCEPYSG